MAGHVIPALAARSRTSWRERVRGHMAVIDIALSSTAPHRASVQRSIWRMPWRRSAPSSCKSAATASCRACCWSGATRRRRRASPDGIEDWSRSRRCADAQLHRVLRRRGEWGMSKAITAASASTARSRWRLRSPKAARVQDRAGARAQSRRGEGQLNLRPAEDAAPRAIRFFRRVTGFRLDCGWWVFDGAERQSQRPSWNYRRSGGGTPTT